MTVGTRKLESRLEAPTRCGVFVVDAFEEEDADAGVEVEESVLIGTSQVCQLQLKDPTVSRRHLELEPGPMGLHAVDLGSRNGTWLGDRQRIESVHLAPGERIRVGSTTLEVRALGKQKSASDLPPITSFGRFVGQSKRLQPMYRALTRVAGSISTILLEGESGVGKELLAEAIHDNSPRAEKPFIVVDCSSLPDQLIESELFGHEEGSFTGATKARAGAFEAADGGTIFLDEIGELPLTLQSRLLRVLAERKVRRVGGTASMEVDVRVVAATNRNLDLEVEEGRFRLDLFHRLAVVMIRVPPLRERKEDIPLLARKLIGRHGAQPDSLTQDILDRLHSYEWPGNVRELRNHIDRFWALGELSPPGADPVESLDDLACSGKPFKEVRQMVLDLLMKKYLDDMLDRHEGNLTHAAEGAGIDRRYFQRMRQRLASREEE